MEDIPGKILGKILGKPIKDKYSKSYLSKRHGLGHSGLSCPKCRAPTKYVYYDEDAIRDDPVYECQKCGTTFSD